jgi:molybdenum cofactor cytidylyltransferase
VSAAPWAVRHIAVLSVDQWRVSDRDLDRLVRAANRLPAAAAYDGQVGIPAVFPGRMRPWLLALHGDRGARTLLARGPVNAVNMPAAGEDLDTVADLARLRAAGCLGDPGFIRCGRCKGDDS